MQVSRPLGAMLGAALALTAGGIAVGFYSHPVGELSSSTFAGAVAFEVVHGGVYDYRDGYTEAYVEWANEAGAVNQTRVSGSGYSAHGEPLTGEYAYLDFYHCDANWDCDGVWGPIKNFQVSRDALMDNFFTISGRVRGHDVLVSLSAADSNPTPAEYGYHEASRYGVWVEESVQAFRDMRLTEISIDGRTVPLADLRWNWGHSHRGAYAVVGEY